MVDEFRSAREYDIREDLVDWDPREGLGRSGGTAAGEAEPDPAHAVDDPLEPVAPLRVLLMCNYDVKNAATMCDHVNAFLRYSRHEVFVISRLGRLPESLDLNWFDVVLIHYSLALALDPYVDPHTRYRLAEFRGLKALFIQDEYRFVADTVAAIRQTGVGLVFTCLGASQIAKVYPRDRLPGVRFETVLTGYVPPWLTVYPPIPLARRPIMVGYRGRTYPAWHGEAGREKARIGERFRRDAARYGLRTDIAWSERSRLYGRAWLDFTRRCRGVLAVESGASVFDFDGAIAARSESFARLAARPSRLSFLDRKVPYEALRERYFKGLEDRIDLAQVSPRIFEAAALRTLIVGYEGAYSGVLQPWRTYVPLRKDHANMARVVEIVRDPEASAEIIANAYAEVALNPRFSYKTFVPWVDGVLRQAAAGRRRSQGAPYTPAAFHGVYGFRMIDNPHDLHLGLNLRGKVRGAARRGLKLIRRGPRPPATASEAGPARTGGRW